jgi:hypothetical protein
VGFLGGRAALLSGFQLPKKKKPEKDHRDAWLRNWPAPNQLLNQGSFSACVSEQYAFLNAEGRRSPLMQIDGR